MTTRKLSAFVDLVGTSSFELSVETENSSKQRIVNDEGANSRETVLSSNKERPEKTELELAWSNRKHINMDELSHFKQIYYTACKYEESDSWTEKSFVVGFSIYLH